MTNLLSLSDVSFAQLVLRCDRVERLSHALQKRSERLRTTFILRRPYLFINRYKGVTSLFCSGEDLTLSELSAEFLSQLRHLRLPWSTMNEELLTQVKECTSLTSIVLNRINVEEDKIPSHIQITFNGYSVTTSYADPVIRPTNLFLRLEDLSTPVPEWAKNVIIAVNGTLTNHSVERIRVQPSSTELELNCNSLKTLLFSRNNEGSRTTIVTTPKLETLSLQYNASINTYPKSLTSLYLFSITVEACSKLDLPCLNTLQIVRLNRVADAKVFKAEEVFPASIHTLILSDWCVRLDFSNSHKIRTLTWLDRHIIDPLPPSLTKLSAGVTKTEVYIMPLKELAVLEYRPMVKRFYWPPNIVSITISCVGEYHWPTVMPHRLKYLSLRGWCAPTLEELPEWTNRVRVVRNP